MKQIIIRLSFFFTLLVSALSAVTVEQKSTDIAKAIFVKGKVQYICHEDKKSKKILLKKDSLLQNGCEIIVKETKEKSDLVIIGFGKNFESKMKLVAPSSVTITKETHGTIENKDYKTIDRMVLGAGNILINYVNKEKDQNKLEVKTAKASLGVRGTEFFAYADKENNFSVAVDSGVVAVTGSESEGSSSSEAVPVEKGKGTIVATDGSVPPPKELAWSKSINWEVDPKSTELKHKATLFSEIDEQYKQWNREIEEQRRKYQE